MTPNRTLNNLYINPLLDILDRQNAQPQLLQDPNPNPKLHGVFDTVPEQSLIFLIDFKTAGEALWPYFYASMDPFSPVINSPTIIEGPIIVIGTGNTPFDKVVSDESNPHHDVFFDAPLEKMYEGPNGETSPPPAPDGTPDPSAAGEDGGQGSGADPDAINHLNSFYASVAIPKALGKLSNNGEFSPHQLELLRGQLRGAHKRELKARYWDLPFWPINLRNQVWKVLVEEGVDLLNVDDLKGATERDWDVKKGWWRGVR